MFETYEEAMKWIEAGKIHSKREHGSENVFLTSPEYRKAYPEIKKLYKQSKKEYGEDAEKAMREVGQWYGNQVYYDLMGQWSQVTRLEGEIVRYRGSVKVKLFNKFENKRYIPWHKGWKLIVEYTNP